MCLEFSRKYSALVTPDILKCTHVAMLPWYHGQYTRTYLLDYLLTPWSSVLLEKLTAVQLVKKFPAFYGSRRLSVAFTSARQL